MRTSSVLSIDLTLGDQRKTKRPPRSIPREAPPTRPGPGFVPAAAFVLAAGFLSAREPHLVRDATGRPAGYDPAKITQVGDRLYFRGFDPEHGAELWVTDGTEAGTKLVKDIYPGPSDSGPRGLTAFSGQVFFSAYDFETGRELWASDGTEAGTRLLKDIWPGRYPPIFYGDQPYSSWPGGFTPLGDRLLFGANDGEHGGELWVTDGTEAGTRVLKDIYPGERWSSPMGQVPRTLVLARDRVFFNAHEPEHGTELWVTDGTEAGTTLLKDIWPGWRCSKPGSFTIAGNRLYFLADYPDCGRELWVTDATEAGTVFLADTCPGLGLGVCEPPDRLTPLGDRLYFTAVDPEHGEELWGTDGTPAGTRLVADACPGPKPSNPRKLTPAGDRLFFTAYDFEHGRELWVTDGTKAGTKLVLDIYPGVRDSGPGELAAAGNRLFFAADHPELGRELWVTDGTEAGTRLVADIHPGRGFSWPSVLTPFREWVFFVANDGEHGEELWMTDGTDAGTRLVADLYPGPQGSWPSDFTSLGDSLFFVADDAEGSRRLWALFVGSPETPWASFAKEPRGCEPGRKVVFDGTRSSPGKDLEIVRYEWRIEEAVLEGPKVEYELPQRLSGPLKVCLTVTNGRGLSDTSCEEICIADRFRRGDANADGKMNISDAVTILGYLFLGGGAGCLDAADADDGGTVNLADAIALLGHLFRAGPALPAPYLNCGADPTPDGLGCAFYPGCR